MLHIALYTPFARRAASHNFGIPTSIHDVVYVHGATRQKLNAVDQKPIQPAVYSRSTIVGNKLAFDVQL